MVVGWVKDRRVGRVELGERGWVVGGELECDFGWG